MGKVLRIGRLSESQFTMSVELASGHKEKWTYIREDTSTGPCYSLVDREDIRK